MFDLVDRPLIWISVRWKGLAPGPNDGLAVPIEHEVELLIDLLDRDEFNTMFMSGEVASEDAIVERIVRNWRKVAKNGTAVPFNTENMAILRRAPGFAQAFTEAFLAAMSGKRDTREGNSEGSLSDGRAAEAPEAGTTTNSTGNANGSA